MAPIVQLYWNEQIHGNHAEYMSIGAWRCSLFSQKRSTMCYEDEPSQHKMSDGDFLVVRQQPKDISPKINCQLFFLQIN